MINKISNLKLILGLVLLGLVYLVVVYFDSPKSAELERELVSIDTAKVTSIAIEDDDETVLLFKEPTGWEVALASGTRVTAKSDKVQSLLVDLLNIQADRLAAKQESKWPDYGVDSAGVSVKVMEGNKVGLDMVVGQVGTSNYIRLAGETEVYASDQFKGLKGQDQINSYRNNTFVEMATDSVETINFTYPADSSFQLIHSADGWAIDAVAADSTKVSDYLRLLKLKYSNDFSGQDGNSLGAQIAQITITPKDQAPVTLTAYRDNADSVVFQSSVNPETFFRDESIGSDFFVSKYQLLNP